MGEALNYALVHWEGFEAYHWVGQLETDNHPFEGAIRPTKRRLKNHLFIGAAEVRAACDLFDTAVANGQTVGIDGE